ALAAVAELNGHTVQIIDPKRLVKSRRLAFDPTLYESAAPEGLGAGPGGGAFWAWGVGFFFFFILAPVLNGRSPELRPLLGGPHATMLHRQILERFSQFDVVVRYEADEILPDVLKNLAARNFAGIPGLSWRSSKSLHFNPGTPKVENLDCLPIVNYDHYPV